jgi:hypothetical protein
MQPLKPEDKKAALDNNPQAAPEDLQEYERLLALRFARDPLTQENAQPLAREAMEEDLEDRLQALHKKLFSDKNRTQGRGA